VKIHAAPEFVETQIPAPGPAATSLCPSAEEARLSQLRLVGAVVKSQEPPKSDEVQIPPPSTAATNLEPLVEQAMEAQLLLGASLKLQFAPEFLE
jgi:hypothetical protein